MQVLTAPVLPSAWMSGPQVLAAPVAAVPGQPFFPPALPRMQWCGEGWARGWIEQQEG